VRGIITILDDIPTLKAELRRHVSLMRDRIENGSAKAEQACRHAAAISLPQGAIVSAYWPMRSELDCRPLMMALHDRGHPIALPSVRERGGILTFYAWRPGDALIADSFGTQRPRDGAIIVPRILFVPLLAFDRRLFRLGYGGGYYDRTLRGLRAEKPIKAYGIAFAAQEIQEVPHHSGDEPLDGVITEQTVIGPT
jgi:5-formyltetrahydrofolate cyclo-ligase